MPLKPEIQNEKPNATLEALLRGYVVASVGAMGRTLKDGEKFIKDEFENRTYERKIICHEGTMENVNEDKFNPIDGKALKYCDKLSAYIEAGISISYGVKSKELTDGFNNMYKFFSEKPKIDGVDFLEICDDFNEHFGLERPPLR